MDSIVNYLWCVKGITMIYNIESSGWSLIKIIKYSVYVLMTLIFLVYCGETAYSELYDSSLENFNCIVFSKAYDKSEVSADLKKISEKYDLCAYYNIYEYSDSEIDIYCCTNNSRDDVCERLGFSSCDFNTILYGSYSIVMINEKDRDSIVSGDYVIPDFSFSADESVANQICRELEQKYEFTFQPTAPFQSSSVGVWAICAALVMLMTVYDMLASKKEICIKLTLGCGLLRQISIIILKDTLMFLISGVLLALLMFSYTAVILVMCRYISFILSICIINALVFIGIYLTDVCSTLKNENSSSSYMPINYILKLISTSVLICVLCTANNFPQLEKKQNCANDIAELCKETSRIELSESPMWSVMIDKYGYETTDEYGHEKVGELIEREMADYSRFLKALDKKHSLFLLNGFNYITNGTNVQNSNKQNVILASDGASIHITEQTGISPADSGITIMLPESYSRTDLKNVEAWLKMLSENYNFRTTYLNYTSAELAAFEFTNSSVIADSPLFSITSSPIIIYTPHAADYDYFNMQTVFSDADLPECKTLLKLNGIHSTRVDVSSVNSLTGSYIRKIKSFRMSFALVLVLLTAYYISVLISTLMVDININKRERAVRRIIGRTFINRYLVLLLSLIVSLALSVAISLAVNKKYVIGSTNIIYYGAVTMLILEITSVIIAAKLDEKHNTLKELKGGAL